MTLSDKHFGCFDGLCLVERQLAVGFFLLSTPDMTWGLIQHLCSTLRICNSSYSVYVCLDTGAGVLFISAVAVGWVHSSHISSCGKQECMYGHKPASCSFLLCDWTEIQFFVSHFFVLIPYIPFTHGTSSLKMFSEVNLSLYFSLFWRKSLLFSSAWNESTFKLGPKYDF